MRKILATSVFILVFPLLFLSCWLYYVGDNIVFLLTTRPLSIVTIFFSPLSLLEHHPIPFLALVIGGFCAGLLSKGGKNGFLGGIFGFAGIFFCYLWLQPGSLAQPALYVQLFGDVTFLSNSVTSFVVLTIPAAMGGKLTSSEPEIKIQTLVSLENDALKQKLLERKLLASIQNKVAKNGMVNLYDTYAPLSKKSIAQVIPRIEKRQRYKVTSSNPRLVYSIDFEKELRDEVENRVKIGMQKVKRFADSLQIEEKELKHLLEDIEGLGVE